MLDDLKPAQRLAELFATVSLELRAGRPRGEALKNMARKSGVQEIQSFATLVIQSDKLGASIGTALKIYAAEMREGRRMRAEEKAHRLPVLLYYYEGYRQREIAALLGVPEETVRTRLSRARDKLKHILSEVPQYA